MQQEIKAWCQKYNLSHFTFFHLFNIENDWIFHAKEVSFETKPRRQFKLDVEDAFKKEIKEEIKERIQEYCKDVIYKNKLGKDVMISQNDEEMYIVYYNQDMVQLDLFLKLASSRFTVEMIQDLKLGKSILIDNVSIQLQLRELW